MTLRLRLAFGIVGIVLVMLVPLVIALRAMQQLRHDTEQLRDIEFTASVVLGKGRTTLQELDQSKEYLSLFPDERTRVRFATQLDSLRVMIDSLGVMTTTARTPRVMNALLALENEPGAAVQLAARGRVANADSIIDLRIAPALADIDRAMSLISESLQQQTRDRVSSVATASELARRTALMFVGAAALLAVLIGLWLTQSVSRPIDELDAGMRAVAAGDFGRPLGIASGRRDEFGRLAASYTSMATQLRELDRLKAEFISVASHELKTPINVITGYLALLRENVYGSLTPKQLEIINTLAAQGKSLSRLVRGLLDVSRFEAGGGRIDPRTIALPAFVGDLERTFRVLAVQRDVTFTVTRVPELPPEVVWDPEQINEVLGNLLSNAFKFTTGGGEVKLDVAVVDGMVQMAVSDSGAGIPAAQLPYVFEKFYTADNQTTGLKGTGLGLAIAKGIVSAHGGQINVQSTVGVGTSFVILLPVRPPRGAPMASRGTEMVA